MKLIKNLIQYKAQKGARSERAEIIGKFTDTLNLERKGTKYPPLTYQRIAVKLSHLSLQDLYYLWSTCVDAKNFSQFFWYTLKPVETMRI